MNELMVNQSGCAVPTEYEAIRNMTRRPGGVAHYDRPDLDKRQKAVDAYREAKDAGMTEEESVQLAAMTAGITGEWIACIPGWAGRAVENRKQIRYTKEEKRKIVSLVTEYRKKGISNRKSLQMVNKELGTKVSLESLRQWTNELGVKSPSLRKQYTDEEKQNVIELFNKYRASMTTRKAANEVNKELGTHFDPALIFRWIRTAEEKEVKTEEKTVCTHCGQEIPSIGIKFAFCPFCGGRLETERERMIRLLSEVKTLTEEDEGKLFEVSEYLKNMEVRE